MYKKLASILIGLVLSAIALSGAGVAFADEESPQDGSPPANVPPSTDPARPGHRRGGGVVTAIGADHFTLLDRRGSERVIYVDENTRFTDKDGQPLTFADLDVGDRVLGRASQRQDGKWYAERVRILPPPTRYQGGGIVNAVGADSFDFTNRRGRAWEFYVDENTQYTDRQGNPHSFGEVQPGMRLFVRAELREDGKWWATVVRFPMRAESGQRAPQMTAAP